MGKSAGLSIAMFCGLAAAIAPARSSLVTGVTDVRPRVGVAICSRVSPLKQVIQ
jgi:hypothetical protein